MFGDGFLEILSRLKSLTAGGPLRADRYEWSEIGPL